MCRWWRGHEEAMQGLDEGSKLRHILAGDTEILPFPFSLPAATVGVALLQHILSHDVRPPPTQAQCARDQLPRVHGSETEAQPIHCRDF